MLTLSGNRDRCFEGLKAKSCALHEDWGIHCSLAALFSAFIAS